jgi:hypothetical protein
MQGPQIWTSIYFRNKGVAAFLGADMSQQLSRYEKELPGSCETVFRSTCPWDSKGVTTIVMKLMVTSLYAITQYIPKKQIPKAIKLSISISVNSNT